LHGAPRPRFLIGSIRRVAGTAGVVSLDGYKRRGQRMDLPERLDFQSTSGSPPGRLED
jgi:hypothetical protein